MRFIQQDKNRDAASYMDSHWCSHPTLASQPLWTFWAVSVWHRVTSQSDVFAGRLLQYKVRIIDLFSLSRSIESASAKASRPQGPKAPHASPLWTAQVCLIRPRGWYCACLAKSTSQTPGLQGFKETPSDSFKCIQVSYSIFKHIQTERKYANNYAHWDCPQLYRD